MRINLYGRAGWADFTDAEVERLLWGDVVIRHFYKKPGVGLIGSGDNYDAGRVEFTLIRLLGGTEFYVAANGDVDEWVSTCRQTVSGEA